MILIDTNALVILLIGSIDVKLINTHKRTSIYEEQDFHDLILQIRNFNELVVLPNVWTEVDNLLNNFSGNYKYMYIESLKKLIELSNEKYLESITAVENIAFFDLGLTDSLLLEHAKSCQLLITSDSTLSDYAVANGIRVYDLVKNRNQRA